MNVGDAEAAARDAQQDNPRCLHPRSPIFLGHHPAMPGVCATTLRSEGVHEKRPHRVRDGEKDGSDESWTRRRREKSRIASSRTGAKLASRTRRGRTKQRTRQPAPDTQWNEPADPNPATVPFSSRRTQALQVQMSEMPPRCRASAHRSRTAQRAQALGVPWISATPGVPGEFS